MAESDSASLGEFWAFVRRRASEQDRLIEKLRDRLRGSAVPVPQEIVDGLLLLPDREARAVLRDHPGFLVAQRLASYEAARAVFDQSVIDLLGLLVQFEHAAVDGTLMLRQRQTDLSVFEGRVQKELFAAASAAHSLIDHSRRLNKVVDCSEYDAKRLEFFGEDGLAEFVIAMRVMLHHLFSVQANWQLQRDYREGTEVGTFVLDHDLVANALEEVGSGVSGIVKVKAFLASQKSAIDLRLIFEAYRSRLTRFHVWFGAALRDRYLASAADYDRCLKARRDFAARSLWSALIGNWLTWPVPPNPYNHLKTYLTEEEVAVVMALPLGSVEQIDRVIEFVDAERACDENVRKLVHCYFEKAIIVHGERAALAAN